jgi:hypothetical protein
LLKPSGLILQLSEGIRLPVVLVGLFVLKISLPVRSYGQMIIFEIIAVEVKGIDPIYTWEIIGIYRVPNENMFTIERLATRNLPTRNLTKRKVTGGDLNLPQADWEVDAEKASGF